MEDLKNTIRRRLAEKYLGNQAIGVLAVRAVQKLYPDRKFSGYVKFTTIFLVTQDQKLKIEFFREKQKILNEVNQALERIGYSVKIRNLVMRSVDPGVGVGD